MWARREVNVILSGATVSHRETAAQSKDLYFLSSWPRPFTDVCDLRTLTAVY
jgi:hypothetical protein